MHKTRMQMLAQAGRLFFAEEPTPAAEGGASTRTAQDAEQTQGDPADGLGEGGKKALEAERKRAAEAEKQAKALQAQLDALNDSKLTETERLQKQIEDLSTRYEQAQLAEARQRVAVAEQIPSQLVGYLAGSDEAELIDSARTLKAAITEATKPGTPKPDPSQGAQGKPLDPTAIAAAGVQRMAAAFEHQLTSKP